MKQHPAIFPRLSSLAMAGDPIRLSVQKRASYPISRRELQRLIADMVD